MWILNHSPRVDRRRAAILAMTAVCMVPLVGILALTLDGGRMLLESRSAQAVADTSALAAAYSFQINWGTNGGVDTGGLAKKAAIAIAGDNGYSSPVPIVNIPPTVTKNLVFLSPNVGYVEVIITNNVPRGFSSIWGSATLPISARAVARAKLTAYSPFSVLLLAQNGTSLSIAGSASVVATNTGIQVDSSSSSAVNVNNMGYAQAPTINMVGDYVSSSGGYLTGSTLTSDGNLSVIDPLSAAANSSIDPFPPPDPSSLPARSFTTGSVINPGVYAQPLSIGGGQTVSMNPGVYYLEGGLSIANGSTVTGTGVTIYNTGSGPISFQGGANITLSAASTGPYANLVIYQNRSSSTGINIANNATTNITGTIYAPSANMSLAGGSSTSQYGSQLIVASLTASNAASVKIQWSLNNVASTIKSALVE